METAEETSLRQTIANIESEEDMDKREELISTLINSVAAADIQTMLVELGAMEQRHSQQNLLLEIRLGLIRRWAQYDGSRASAWVQQLAAGPAKEEALNGVAIEWANSSLSEAMAWGQQLAEPAEKQAVLFSIANEAVRQDPVVALRLAVELPTDERWKDLVQRSASEWAATNGEQAVAWARQIEDAPLRNQVLASMAVAMSESDPVAAATLATTEIPAGRTQSDAVIGIIERWGQQQPEQVAAWVETFPRNNLKSVAVENLVAMWSLSDSHKAEEWRSQIQAGQ